MRGRVLGYNSGMGEGVVSGDDGRRYTVARDYIRGGAQSLTAGMEVDFEVGPYDVAEAVFPVVGTAAPASGKNNIVAGVLAIIFGSLGVHKFYLGYTTAGLIMLVLTVGGIFLAGIPTFIVALVAFVEGIIYLVKGRDQFHHDYVAGRRPWF